MSQACTCILCKHVHEYSSPQWIAKDLRGPAICHPCSRHIGKALLNAALGGLGKEPNHALAEAASVIISMAALYRVNVMPPQPVNIDPADPEDTSKGAINE